MPYVTITLDHVRPEAELAQLRAAVMDSVQAALAHPESPCLRVVIRGAAAFSPPPSVRGAFVLIEIELLAGRSRETKRALFGRLAEAVAVVGIAPGDYRVLLRELDPQNVCIGHGTAAADSDLGYSLNV